jgi:hypothetical protein
MKISGQAVVNAVAWLYRTFLKGRNVKIGGTEVALPSQGQSAVPPPRTGLDQPHQFNKGPLR